MKLTRLEFGFAAPEVKWFLSADCDLSLGPWPSALRLDRLSGYMFVGPFLVREVLLTPLSNSMRSFTWETETLPVTGYVTGFDLMT